MSTMRGQTLSTWVVLGVAALASSGGELVQLIDASYEDPIVDADTVIVWPGWRARIVGFDAPEASRRWARCESERAAGLAATAHLVELIENNRDRVRVRLAVFDLDRNGRLLVRITIGGRDLAAIAVEEGWGQHWVPGHGPKPGWCAIAEPRR